jgi:hypothetical protein
MVSVIIIYNSAVRPLGGKIPAGLNCKKAIIKAKIITFAMLVVEKKVKKSVRGFSAATEPKIRAKVPEPIK